MIAPYELKGIAERFSKDNDFRSAVIRRLLEHIKFVEEQAKFNQGKVLVVMESDGFTQVFADDWTSVKLLNLLPHQDPEEAVKKLGRQWDQLYVQTNATEVARPHYLSEPNRMTHQDVVEYAERFLAMEAAKEPPSERPATPGGGAGVPSGAVQKDRRPAGQQGQPNDQGAPARGGAKHGHKNPS